MTAMDAFLIGFSSVLTVSLKMNIGIGVSSKNPKVPSNVCSILKTEKLKTSKYQLSYTRDTK